MTKPPTLNLTRASDILDRLLYTLPDWKFVTANPREAPYTALQGPDELETLGITFHDQTRVGRDLWWQLPYSASFLFSKEEEVVSDITGLRIRWKDEQKLERDGKDYFEFGAVAEGPDYTCIFITVWSRKPVATKIKEVLKQNHWLCSVERRYEPITSDAQLKSLIDRSNWLSKGMIKALETCDEVDARNCAHHFADFSRKIYRNKKDWPDLLAMVDYIIREAPLDDWLDEEIDNFYELIGQPGDSGKMNSPQLISAIADRKQAAQQWERHQEQERAEADAFKRGDHLSWKTYRLYSAISAYFDAEENSWLDPPTGEMSRLVSDLQSATVFTQNLANRVGSLFNIYFPEIDNRIQINIMLETDTKTGEPRQVVTSPRYTLVRPLRNSPEKPAFSVVCADVHSPDDAGDVTLSSLLITFLVEFIVEISDEAESWVLHPGEENPFDSPESFDSFNTGFFQIEPRRWVVTNNVRSSDQYQYTEYFMASTWFLSNDSPPEDGELEAELVSVSLEQHKKALLMDYDDEATITVSATYAPP